MLFRSEAEYAKKSPMIDEELQEAINQLSETLSKSASAADWIHDFVHSKNPKFAGKSKEERKQMALGAYYGKQRNEETKEIEEGLKGNQVKLDKNKNGKLDKQDFKILRKENIDEEELDEATLSAKAGRAGKDLGAPGKTFKTIAKAAAKRYGSEESGKKVAGAILKKMRSNEEVENIQEYWTVHKHNENNRPELIGSPTKFSGSAISTAMKHLGAGRNVTVKKADHLGAFDSVVIKPGDHVKNKIASLKPARPGHSPIPTSRDVLNKEEIEQIDEKQYEGSPEDIKKDKEGMKRTGMTAKEWENSEEDKKKDEEGQRKLDKMAKMKEDVEQLEETPMDSFMHPKHGKVEWNNEGGSHVIVTKKPTGGKTIHAMGTHQEISQKFKNLKAKFAKEDVDLSIKDALSMIEEDAKKKSLVPDYTDSEWGDKIKSLKQKAQSGEGKIAYNPKTGKYGVAFDSKKLKETMIGKLAN